MRTRILIVTSLAALSLILASCASIKRPAPEQPRLPEVAESTFNLSDYQVDSILRLYAPIPKRLQPQRAGDIVIVPQSQGLTAFSLEDWQSLWDYEGAIEKMKVHGDLLWIKRQDSMELLNVNTGSVLWHNKVVPESILDVEMGNSMLIISGYPDRIAAYSLVDGRKMWERTLQHLETMGMLAIAAAQQKIYVYRGGHGISELDLFTGLTLRRISIDSNLIDTSTVLVHDPDLFKIDDANLLVRYNDKNIMAFDLESGSQRWVIDQQKICCAQLLQDNHLLLQDYDGLLMLYSSLDGTLLWENSSFTYHYIADVIQSGPVLTLADSLGNIHRLDLKSGRTLSSMKILGNDPSGQQGWVYALDDTRIAVVLSEGILVSLSQ